MIVYRFPNHSVGQKMSFHTVVYWNSEPWADYEYIKEIRRWAIVTYLFSTLNQNHRSHKFKDAVVQTIATRWLITQETDFCEEETENIKTLPWFRRSVLGFWVLRPQCDLRPPRVGLVVV
jgi:hypothetical protein